MRSLRPSPSLVISLIALFVALGGTSYAVATGAIGSKQIKNNSILSKDIKNNQITGKDVHDGSLLAKDFKAGQLPAGPAGTQGLVGPQGAPGANGSPAASMLAGRFPFPTSTGPSDYVSPLGIAATIGDEADVSMLSPATTVVARDLAVDAVTSSPAIPLVTTLSVNGVDTALTCSIANPVTRCTDTTHGVTIPPSSSIALHVEHITGGGTGAPPDVKFGWRATTP